MKLKTNGVVFDTEASWLLQEHVLREKLPVQQRAGLLDPTWTSGIERLYELANPPLSTARAMTDRA